MQIQFTIKDNNHEHTTAHTLTFLATRTCSYGRYSGFSSVYDGDGGRYGSYGQSLQRCAFYRGIVDEKSHASETLFCAGVAHSSPQRDIAGRTLCGYFQTASSRSRLAERGDLRRSVYCFRMV